MVVTLRRAAALGFSFLLMTPVPTAAWGSQGSWSTGGSADDEPGAGVIVDDEGFGGWTDGAEGDDQSGEDGGTGAGRETDGDPGRGSPPAPYERYGEVVPGPGCDWETEVLVQVFLVTHDADWVRTETLVRFECYELTEWEAETAPEPPTVSPGYAAELAKVRWPVPSFEMNPRDYAVTGIETRVWYGDDGTLALTPIDHDGDPSTPGLWGATVTVADPLGVNRVTVSAWITEYVWEMGDGTRLTSRHPGSADDWAAEHLYTSTSPENEVQAFTVWNGSYTATGPGGTVGGPIPTTTVPGERVAYPVYQIRSAPVAPSRAG